MRRLLLGLLVVSLAACSSTKRADDAFFKQMGTLSKEEILAKGDTLAADKDWDEARKYYSFVADSFPNDPLGRQAALKVADSFFNQGKDLESITEAQLRYKDFTNRFPNDPGRAYALLMLGKTYFEQQRGPQRDLKPVHEALDSFKQLVSAYPDSTYAKEAGQLIIDAVNTLASHELQVAVFYARQRAWRGAKQRLDYLLANYPQASAAEEAQALLTNVEQHMSGDEGATAPASPATVDHSGGVGYRDRS